MLGYSLIQTLGFMRSELSFHKVSSWRSQVQSLVKTKMHERHIFGRTGRSSCQPFKRDDLRMSKPCSLPPPQPSDVCEVVTMVTSCGGQQQGRIPATLPMVATLPGATTCRPGRLQLCLHHPIPLCDTVNRDRHVPLTSTTLCCLLIYEVLYYSLSLYKNMSPHTRVDGY